MMLFDTETFRKVIDEMIPLHRFLGITMEEISDGYAVLSLPFKPELIGDPRADVFHGGILATLLDSAGGAAAMTTLLSPQDRISTIDMRVDFLLPAKGESIIAEGKIVRSGNRIVVTTMKAWYKNTGEVVAEGKGVYNVKRKKDEK